MSLGIITLGQHNADFDLPTSHDNCVMLMAVQAGMELLADKSDSYAAILQWHDGPPHRHGCCDIFATDFHTCCSHFLFYLCSTRLLAYLAARNRVRNFLHLNTKLSKRCICSHRQIWPQLVVCFKSRVNCTALA